MLIVPTILFNTNAVMLSAITLNVILLNVIMANVAKLVFKLNVIILSVIMLNAIALIVIIMKDFVLNVVMLCVIMLNGMAPVYSFAFLFYNFIYFLLEKAFMIFFLIQRNELTKGINIKLFFSKARLKKKELIKKYCFFSFVS
jgi:hypothetical protein